MGDRHKSPYGNACEDVSIYDSPYWRDDSFADTPEECINCLEPDCDYCAFKEELDEKMKHAQRKRQLRSIKKSLEEKKEELMLTSFEIKPLLDVFTPEIIRKKKVSDVPITEFECFKNKKLFLNIKKINKSHTVREHSGSFTINGFHFEKDLIDKLFNKGMTVNELRFFGNFYKIIRKNGSYYFSDDKKDSPNRIINLYYFDITVDDVPKSTGIKAKYDSDNGIQFDKTENKKEEGDKKMTGLNKSMNDIVNINKEAAKSAAMIKVGSTANDTVCGIVAKNILPNKYKKFAKSPFFGLVVANATAVAMKQFIPNKNEKTDAVADAMVLASMIDITNMIDFNSIVKQVMESVDLSVLTGEDEK